MKIIGLTGPSGGGKSTVAAVAGKMGFAVIDCDKVARETVCKGSEVLERLCKEFGEDILLSDGSLNRRYLAAKAFADQDSTERLNRITLPAIADRIKEKIAAFSSNGVEAILLDAPTLYESGIDAICDSVIAVLCPANLRRARIIARDGLTDEQAESRLSASKPDEFYTKRTEHTVYNNGDMEDFKHRAAEMLSGLVK